MDNTDEQLDHALGELVRMGLIEIIVLENGQPGYRVRSAEEERSA